MPTNDILLETPVIATASIRTFDNSNYRFMTIN